ncbi:hypothetical protein RhiirC2_867931 [Rhizophagus irregularis]|uniref:MIR domain-containing protein n=1 Tax=Rhizophagus irregularis TaxID=588596 RepID=A0A2N1MZR9_9GLOM|nr:hypothetical protein RhiirC2_867931 [Rhizophagus irregularis]
MQDNKDKRPCKKLKVNFTYKKPTDDELRNLIDSSRCKNTDYSTSNWIRALEKFRTDVNYQGLIEEVDTKEELEDQLCRFVHAMRKKDGSEYHVSSVNSCMFAINRHLNNKSVLSKPINIMDKDQYYKLWQILNGKVKSLVSQGRGERNGADGFTEDDLLQILDHPAMSGNDPASLLYRIFFFNAIFLGLRGGEHFNLQLQNFIRRKDKYGGFDVIIYKSKTNQRGANNIESQGDKLYIPEIPSIIEMYENYFTKRPTQADPHFYLKPCNISEGNWDHNVGINSLGNGFLLNKWYHIAFTLSDPEKRLDIYVDGEWIGFYGIMSVKDQKVVFNDGPLLIGRAYNYHGFSGEISNVRYFNWRLSVEEVMEDFFNESQKKPIVYGSKIALIHVSTEKYLSTKGIKYDLGSQNKQYMVICNGQEIDLKNDDWIVIGANDKGINEGDLVSLNNIIGFKHQATGCYLHSHDTNNHERVTPISKQQQGDESQEVSCY